MSTSPLPSLEPFASSTNMSTTYSSSIPVPSMAVGFDSNTSACSNSSYTQTSKIDLKIDLNSSSNHSSDDGLKMSVTPLTPTAKQSLTFAPHDNDDHDQDDDAVNTKHYKVTVGKHHTPTPTMTKTTPSVHVKDAAEFPVTEPVMESIKESVEEQEAKITATATTPMSGNETEEPEECDNEDETTDAEQDDDEDVDADGDGAELEKVEENREETEEQILGRFGYEKTKIITKTLQGNIFVAKKIPRDAQDGKGKGKEKEVVIKKTSKQLHNEHVTVQNGRKFGIYENILKECIILKHLTENKNGLIMHSFTKHDHFFEDDKHYYLSMEHGGSDLFDFIIEAHELINAKKLKIKEWRKFTKYLFWQMIVVVKWLHNDMNICHLDISLENILIKNADFVPLDTNKTQYTINSNVQIKFCDFGLAEIFNGEDGDFQCTKFCGKTNYKAPEVYAKKGVFDARKADIWSLGVVLFSMLVGSPPYNKPIDSDPAYLYIKNGIIDQLLFQWERNHFITVKVLSLLHSMLCFDINKRFLVNDVIQHSWLSLYYHKYKHQMQHKSKMQQQKNKRSKPRLPFYKLPSNAATMNISQ